jgi:GNAT superfamily N-acetyltransferase
MDLREFTPADQAAAYALINAGLAEHFDLVDPRFNPDLENIAQAYASGVFLCMWDDTQLIGTGALMPETPGVSRVLRMYVAHTHRRRGIGRRMLDALTAHARARGDHTLVVETTHDWHAAIALYLNTGFRFVETRDGESHFVRAI